MKPSKSIQITLVSLLIIIGLFIFSYYWFIRPMYMNNVDQTRTVMLESDQEIRLGKNSEQGKIFGIELEVKGNANSNLDIYLSNEKGLQHSAAVKGKNLDFTYKNDWYGDSCYIQIIPRGKMGGKATVNCRFLAMD